MRTTAGGLESRLSRLLAAMPKFESEWSGGTIRSSENHTVARLQSRSASAASAYALRGVEPPVSTMSPPRSATSDSRSATAAPGSSSTVISLMRGGAYSEQGTGCRQGGLVRGVAQQRLADALAEDARLAA